MNIKVKICGIRSIDSAQATVSAGADFIGLNFVPTSARRISQEAAREILGVVGEKIKKVGVFQDQPIEYIQQIADDLRFDYVQLHGEEDQEYIDTLKKVGVIKAISLESDFDINQTEDELSRFRADYFLLDRKNRGTGAGLNPEKVKILAQKYSVILGGGLTPESVELAVSITHPAGVDVAGGIETDGVEDIEKIKLFIKNAKNEQIQTI